MALLQAIADLLFPPVCQVCARANGFPLCRHCRQSIRLISPPICLKCGRPIDGSCKVLHTCNLCRRRRPRFACARAAAIYEGTIREAIHGLKFGRRRALASPLGRLMAACAAADLELPSARLVIPVPLHPARLRTRGFNQAELLAREVGRILELPVLTNVIRRNIATAAQSALPLERRWENVRNAFEASGELPTDPVILIDDVISTGFTASACARTLADAGAPRVYVLAAALALPEASKQTSPAARTGLDVHFRELRPTS